MQQQHVLVDGRCTQDRDGRVTQQESRACLTDRNWQRLLFSALSPVGYLVAARSKERLRASSASMRLAKVTVNGTTKYRHPKRRDRLL